MTDGSPHALIANGEEAMIAGDWATARDYLIAAIEQEPSARALYTLGMAHWWLGDMAASVRYREQAYEAARRADDHVAASMAAMSLCLTLKGNYGNLAASNGWAARAESALQNLDPNPLRGWIALTNAYVSADPSRSEALAQEALDLARQTRDTDLELRALSQLGDTLVTIGRVHEGIALLDEAMAGSYGSPPPHPETIVFCSCHMMIACDIAVDFERATQWCSMASEFTSSYGCPFLYAFCRMLYGGLLVLTGRWPDAERELAACLRATEQGLPAIHAGAIARLADLRIRQGRVEEAEALLSGFEEHLATALPAAAIRLAKGQAGLAASMLERRLTLFHKGELKAAPPLLLLVEARLMEGHGEQATSALHRLAELAAESDREQIIALAELGEGLVILGDHPAEAVPILQRATDRFARLGMPLEMARARLELARAIAADTPNLAVDEASGALEAFENLGAKRFADSAASFLRSLGARARVGPKGYGTLTQREEEVLSLVSSGLSNPEIARRLFVSRKTVEHHVSNILAKRGLRSRTEAVAYALKRAVPERLPSEPGTR